MDFFDSVFADQDRQRRERSMTGISMAKVTARMGDGSYSLQYLGMGGNAPSAPARMMSPNAGKQRGMYWMPEVGDEVVVAFEGGDSNSPIILGACFNNQSPTPGQAKPSNDNNVRTIVSRSGHEITLDDSPSAGKVTVKTNGGRTLTLDDTPPGKASLSTPSGISIELDDSTGTLTLSAPLSIVLQTATLMLNVGGMVVAPSPTPGTGIMNITTPTAVSIETSAITMNAGSITLTTPPNMVVVNGVPVP
ncbi:MAG: phage baseplate assembly protein V [Candidatus Sulfopaludibacter sp.]|nr:phage baseplate assembly protein V [Candidatus Sulfopaludibacter sp.]